MLLIEKSGKQHIRKPSIYNNFYILYFLRLFTFIMFNSACINTLYTFLHGTVGNLERYRTILYMRMNRGSLHTTSDSQLDFYCHGYE